MQTQLIQFSLIQFIQMPFECTNPSRQWKLSHGVFESTFIVTTSLGSLRKASQAQQMQNKLPCCSQLAGWLPQKAGCLLIGAIWDGRIVPFSLETFHSTFSSEAMTIYDISYCLEMLVVVEKESWRTRSMIHPRRKAGSNDKLKPSRHAPMSPGVETYIQRGEAEAPALFPLKTPPTPP